MKRRAVPSFTVLLGSALVLALVAALPIALALLPAETLQSQHGPGDLTAAALSTLDRDIQTQRVLTPESQHKIPVFLCLRVPVSTDAATYTQDPSTARDRGRPPLPGSCTPGPTDARHLLLL